MKYRYILILSALIILFVSCSKSGNVVSVTNRNTTAPTAIQPTIEAPKYPILKKYVGSTTMVTSSDANPTYYDSLSEIYFDANYLDENTTVFYGGFSVGSGQMSFYLNDTFYNNENRYSGVLIITESNQYSGKTLVQTFIDAAVISCNGNVLLVTWDIPNLNIQQCVNFAECKGQYEGVLRL